MSINKVLIAGELCALPAPIPEFESSLALLRVSSTDSIKTPLGIQIVSNTHEIVIPVSQLHKLSEVGSQVYIEGSLLNPSILSQYKLASHVVWGKILHAQQTPQSQAIN